MLALYEHCYARMEKYLPDELKAMDDERKQLAEKADKKEKAQKKKDEEEEAAAEKSGNRIPITRQLARKSTGKASKKFQEELRDAQDRKETARDKARRKQLKEFETCERWKKRVRLGGGVSLCAKCICELEELAKAQKAEKEKAEKEKADKEKAEKEKKDKK
jgi:colicin import membrane protein